MNELTDNQSVTPETLPENTPASDNAQELSIESDYTVVVSALRRLTVGIRLNGDYDPHKVTQLAVKAGFIKKFPCYCGSTKVEAHHQDYAKPLKIVWFCGRHHRMHHEVLRTEGKEAKNRHLISKSRWKVRSITQGDLNNERRANLVKARLARKAPLFGRIPQGGSK